MQAPACSHTRRVTAAASEAGLESVAGQGGLTWGLPGLDPETLGGPAPEGKAMLVPVGQPRGCSVSSYCHPHVQPSP